MKFVLEIECDNAAFDEDPGPEVIRILAETVGKLADGGRSVVLVDSNGNSVGRAEFREESAYRRRPQLKIAEFYWCLPPGGGLTLDGPAVQEALGWWWNEASERERDEARQIRRSEDGPTDDELYNRPGVEGGIANAMDDGPGSLGEHEVTS